MRMPLISVRLRGNQWKGLLPSVGLEIAHITSFYEDRLYVAKVKRSL